MEGMENSPLTLAAQKGRLDEVKALLEGGAGVDDKDGDGYTALILAARYNHAEVVDLLLGKGADVNALQNHAKTALMYAADDGYLEIVRRLIAAGADATLRSKGGTTALKVARLGDHTEIAIRRERRLRLLLLEVRGPVRLADERLDLSTEEPQPGVAVRRGDLVAELASPDRRDDLVLRQAELLPRGLVAQRRALALPLTGVVSGFDGTAWDLSTSAPTPGPTIEERVTYAELGAMLGTGDVDGETRQAIVGARDTGTDAVLEVPLDELEPFVESRVRTTLAARSSRSSSTPTIDALRDPCALDSRAQNAGRGPRRALFSREVAWRKGRRRRRRMRSRACTRSCQSLKAARWWSRSVPRNRKPAGSRPRCRGVPSPRSWAR